jgi:hypothetical protein
MTNSVDIDGKRFVFPAGWEVLKYDDSSFHRNQFQGFAGGSKAMDAVAVSPDRQLWLIEVKDYTRDRRSKGGTVFDEVAAKVRATLAGLAAARVRANEADERAIANRSMKAQNIRVVLHLDQPAHSSRLFRQIVDPSSASVQLQRKVRAVDPHAVCYGIGVRPNAFPWAVRRIQDLS